MIHYSKDKSLNLKSENPFFSIVIPTKNRSFLVGYAIESILIQLFNHFEIIIVDNDDTDATKKVVAAFNDSRIHYYKTGNLSMPENWEYGCSKSVGDYLIILQDKMVLKPHSLKTLFKIIKLKKPLVIKWQHDFFNEEIGVGNPSFFPEFKAQFFDSDLIIQSFLDCNLDFFIKHSPIGIDSCINMKIIKMIQKGPMKRLCVPSSPDYTMSFQILNAVDNVFCIPDTLTTMGGIKYSRGVSFFKKENVEELLKKDFKVREFDIYSKAPMKVCTTYNTLINDYINVANVVGDRLKKYQLNKFNYFLYIYDEIQRAKNENVDVAEEMKRWNEALLLQDDTFIKSIRIAIDQMKTKECQRTSLWRIRYLIQMVPKIGLYNVMKGVFKSIQWKLRKEKKFDNILEYVKTW